MKLFFKQLFINEKEVNGYKIEFFKIKRNFIKIFYFYYSKNMINSLYNYNN